MAVVTDTPWDLALDQSVGRPAATAVSPRAAYQDALYRRATLLDLRSPAERAADGDLPARLRAVVLRPEQARGWVVSRPGEPVYVLTADGVAGPLDVGAPAVTGGVSAWRAAGLPLR